MKRSIAKGTPEQFLNRVQNRIAELGGDVEACDKITAASETTYIDDSGIMGKIGDTWTVSELRQYWDAEQMNDPVLSEYDSFESWLEDTTSQMTEMDFTSDYDKYSKDWIAQIKNKLASVGVDVNSPEAEDYAEAAAELVAGDDNHDVDDWWQETTADSMFMYEIDALPHIAESTNITSHAVLAAKDSAAINNAKMELQQVVSDITDGQSLQSIANELSGLLRSSIEEFKIAYEDNDKASTENISVQRIYANKAAKVMQIYEDLIKSFKKPNNFYQSCSAIASAIRKIAENFELDSLSSINDYGPMMRELDKLESADKIQKKLKLELFNQYYTSLVSSLTNDLNMFKKKPKESLFSSTTITANDIEACDAIVSSQEVEESDLLSAFDNCDYEVIDAGYSDDGSIIVSLNYNVDDIDKVAEHLADCLSDCGVEVADWNTNGSNVFVFTPRDDAEPITSARDNDSTYDDRFIHTLMGDIESEVSGEVDGLTFDTLENALNVTVVHGGEVTQFTVPHEDLSFDFDTMSDDVAYVVDTIRESLDLFSLADDVSSATNTCGIACKPEVLSNVNSEVIHGLSWSGLIQELSERGYEVDASYRRSPDEHIVAYKDGKSYDIEVTQYSEGDYEIVLDNISEIIEADTDVYENDDISDDTLVGFSEIATKSVIDSDGSYTDYTMYLNTNTGEYVFVFGDKDIYSPADGNFDWECETEEEAWEWFNSYNGFADDDEEDPEDEFGEW